MSSQPYENFDTKEEPLGEARRRTLEQKNGKLEWTPGLELVARGITAELFGGLAIFFGTVNQAWALLQIFGALVCLAGSIALLMGIIRWAIHPLIHYAEQSYLLQHQQAMRLKKQGGTDLPPKPSS